MNNYFSQDGLKKINEDLEKRKDELGIGDRKPYIEEPGIYTLIMGQPVLRESKPNKGNDRIEIPCFVDAEHEPINKLFDFLTDTGSRMLVEFMQRSFGYQFKPIDSTEQDDLANGIIKQVKAFQKSKFKAAIRIKEKLYTKDDVTKVYKFPEIWYSGTEKEDLKMDTSKGFVPLSAEDKKKLAQSVTGETSSDTKQKKEEDKGAPPAPPAEEKFPWD